MYKEMCEGNRHDRRRAQHVLPRKICSRKCRLTNVICNAVVRCLSVSLSSARSRSVWNLCRYYHVERAEREQPRFDVYTVDELIDKSLKNEGESVSSASEACC